MTLSVGNHVMDNSPPSPQSNASPTRYHSPRRSPLLYTTVIIGVSTLCGFGGGIAAMRLFAPATSSQLTRQVTVEEGRHISELAKTVGESVVSINVMSRATQSDFFGRDVMYSQQSAGTGIIVSENGYVVTNRHVVDANATKVSITLSDGSVLDDVTVVGRTGADDSLDIAILKINNTEGKSLHPATLGSSSSLRVGDKVVAIGNALGQFQNTVTAGILSGYGRSIEAGDEDGSQSELLQNLLQTDAAINSGNSGGPLVNMNSEVIGINTAVASGSAENIGFAIPIDDAKGLIDSVIKTGKFERPYLGVRYVALTDEVASTYTLSVKRGAYLLSGQGGPAIIGGSPAEKAGLKEKDVITKVDGIAIDETHSLTSLVGRRAVGDVVELTIIRAGKEQKVQATLDPYH